MSRDSIIIRGAYKAAGARLLELTNRYPLYSQADEANWMLGQIYEKTEHNEIAARYYSRIVKDYPLSPLVGGRQGQTHQIRRACSSGRSRGRGPHAKR